MTDAPVTAQEQPTCKRHEIPMVLLCGSCTCDQGVIEAVAAEALRYERMYSSAVKEADAIRAENDRLRCSPDKEIQLRTEFGDKLSDAEKLIAAMNAEWIASAIERDALRSKLAKAKTVLRNVENLLRESSNAFHSEKSDHMAEATASAYEDVSAALAEIDP